MTTSSAIELRGDFYGPSANESDQTPMVIAHGLFGSAANWRTAARRFGEQRPVIAVDVRNHGGSPWADEMDYETLGRDLLATIDRVFGRPAILLGHSMGGKAAMAAALAGADKVAAAMIIDIAPLAYEHPEHQLIARAMLRVDLSQLTRRSDAEAALREAAPDPAMRAFLLQNLAFDGEERQARWRPNVKAIEAAVDDLVGWPAALEGRRYGGPSLSIRGGASKYVAPEGLVALQRHLPAIEAVEMEGAGHWPHAEAPDRFLAECDRFLAKLTAGTHA
ncbi:MAG: alpha/beta fold hydrolase [Neomegalonema sp.]|nr:alpha/beta fold hydrolase [Neomegalonema sp.]